MTLGQLAQLPVAEYNQWLAYFEIEPFGPYFEDLRAGQIAAAIYNTTQTNRVDPSELTQWNALHRRQAGGEPILHQDPEKQAAAVAAVFGFKT